MLHRTSKETVNLNIWQFLFLFILTIQQLVRALKLNLYYHLPNVEGRRLGLKSLAGTVDPARI